MWTHTTQFSTLGSSSSHFHPGAKNAESSQVKLVLFLKYRITNHNFPQDSLEYVQHNGLCSWTLDLDKEKHEQLGGWTSGRGKEEGFLSQDCQMGNKSHVYKIDHQKS